MTDAYITASGATIEEAFENAAVGLFDTMTEVEGIRQEIKDEVEVQGHDEYELLYNWIETLLVRFDVNGRVYSKFRVQTLERKNGQLFMRAEAQGEGFDPSRHRRKVEVKAITYHRMEIEKGPSGVRVKYILDL